MGKLTKYSYQLKTKSPLILSPRQQEAFYKGIDYTEEELEEKGKGIIDAKKINIIYPFYRRGEYQGLLEENVAYYIPGSSIKGSLLSKAQKQSESSNSLLIDDIDLEEKNICIDKINKIQNTSPEAQKQIKLESFFENVAMEMCKGNVIKTGHLFSQENPVKYFEKCHEETVGKLKQWSKKILELLNSKKEWTDETRTKLEEVIRNVTTLINASQPDTYLMILGGYKGLFLSILLTNGNNQKTEENQGGLFIDQKTQLPYGLVEISEVKSDE